MPALELENGVFQHRKKQKTGWFCDALCNAKQKLLHLAEGPEVHHGR